MDLLIIILIVLTGLNLILALMVLLKRHNTSGKELESRLFTLEREQNAAMQQTISSFRSDLETRLSSIETRNQELRQSIDTNLAASRVDNRAQLESILKCTNEMKESVAISLNDIRKSTELRLDTIRSENSAQLDKMRMTVDEKLQETLENRLTKSFEQVQKQLESVYKGLGEMQNLAKSVGDLSRLFTNVKSRGVWGEVQVRAILDEILTSDQYVMNFHSRAKSQEVVEFAIKLPGKGDGDEVYLPIDSKFPREDYENYVKAQEDGNIEGIKYYQSAMKNRVLSEAKDISEKYINPPRTTDFAILFLPTESLYAEIMSIPGFSDDIQTRFRVTIAGPTTLSALVNSLQMGFRTLAVEKRSHEVWRLFAQMKKQFSLFANSLASAEKSLGTATSRLSEVAKRTDKLSLKLNNIELPEGDAQKEEDVLELPEVDE